MVMSTYELKVIDWDNKNDETSTEQLVEGYHLWFSLKIILRSIEIFFCWKSVYTCNAFMLKSY